MVDVYYRLPDQGGSTDEAFIVLARGGITLAGSSPAGALQPPQYLLEKDLLTTVSCGQSGNSWSALSITS